MPSRLLLAACLGAAVWSAETAAAAPPWKPSFSVEVHGVERAFVEAGGRQYMLLERPDELPRLTEGQAAAVTAKLRRLPGGRLGLYRADGVRLGGPAELLASALDGDNLHLVGRIAAGRLLVLDGAVPAPSDAQVLQDRLAGLAEDDWDRRLGVVAWCRDQGGLAGNPDWWNGAADRLMGDIIGAMTDRGALRKDLTLVLRALDLALNQMQDPGLAARLASPPWIREHGGPHAEAIARRMRGLGYALYKDAWLPRPLALEREFEDRFAAIPWQDAAGFYRLGRWTDEQGEALPRGRERAWRCYQAGHRADPAHPGIARELGLAVAATAPTATQTGSAALPAADVIDLESGVRVPAPAGWRRGQAIGGRSTWYDPESETSYITVRLLPAPVDGDAQWNVLTAEAAAGPGHVTIGQADEQAGGRRIRSLNYSLDDGEQPRFVALALVTLADDAPAAVIEGRGLPAEQARLSAALAACAAGAARQTPQGAPAETRP